MKIIAFILLLLVIVQAPLAAQTPYTGVNLLFIVDQSGSMGGVRYDGPSVYGEGNDRYDLRFAAPQYALTWLTDLRSASVDVNKPDINFAVLAFGSYPRIIQDWRALDTDRSTWRDVTLPRLLNTLSAERFGPTNLDLTDFQRAFSEAHESFFRPPPSRPGEKFLNVIVVLTDGAPCAAGDTVEQNGAQVYTCNVITAENRGRMEDHLRRLNTFVENSFGSLGYELYVIGLDVPDSNEFWPVLEPLWAEIVCRNPADLAACDPNVRYKRVQASEEIGTQLRAILNDLVSKVAPSTFTNVCAGTLPLSCSVAPYQQVMRLDVFKASTGPLGSIDITGPGGVVTPDQDSGDDTPIRVIRIDNPPAGTWTVTAASAAQVENVTVQTLPAGIRMEPVSGGEILSSVPLVTQLVRGDGVPLPGSASNPDLVVEVLIYDSVLPDRAARPLLAAVPLTRDAARTDIYQFSGAWTPEKPGRHEIRVRATYLDAAGTTQVLIDGQTMQDGVVITGATVEWEGISPLSERVGRPFTGRAVVVNNTTGSPIANLGALAIRAVLRTADDQPYGEIVLTNEGSAPGEMLARFLIDQPGDYRVRLEVGKQSDAAFTVIGNPSDYIPITVRPLRPLELTLMQPGVERMEAQAVAFPPPALTLFTPVEVQIGVRDSLTNTWVSLADVTGGSESKPVLLMNREDLSGKLVEVQPGIYATTVEGLWPGSYTFNASVSTPSELLTGDYVWQASAISHTLHRDWSWRFILALLLLALLIVGAVALVIGIIVYDRQLRVNPLQGTIAFVTRPTDPRASGEVLLKQFDLGRIQRNRQVFRPRDGLPAPLERLVLTSRGVGDSDKGYAMIERLRIKGQEDRRNQLLRPGSEITLGTINDGESVLVLTKDGSHSAASDFLTAATH